MKLTPTLSGSRKETPRLMASPAKRIPRFAAAHKEAKRFRLSCETSSRGWPALLSGSRWRLPGTGRVWYKDRLKRDCVLHNLASGVRWRKHLRQPAPHDGRRHGHLLRSSDPSPAAPPEAA